MKQAQQAILTAQEPAPAAHASALPDTLADYEARARAVLDAATLAYFSGGAGDEITLAANRHAWDSLRLWPRVLRPLAGGHTRCTLLGKTLAHPIVLAPVAHQRMAHADGEIASALAASAMQAGMVLSMQSSTPLEAVARAFQPGEGQAPPGSGPLWMQIYLQHDTAWNQALIARAEAAGYEALVLTVDAPTSGMRDRERRARLRIPPHAAAVHLHNLARPPARALEPGQSALFDDLVHHAPTWRSVDWLCAQTRLPVLLKGVMHPADAIEALQHGVAGLIVSNHGGRTLDTAAPTAHVLPRIVRAVQGRAPVLVDGGIRRGVDVLKAMALGASAVLVGRTALYALASAGAPGVAHALRLLRDELEIAMALTGCATLAQAPRDVALDPWNS